MPDSLAHRRIVPAVPQIPAPQIPAPQIPAPQIAAVTGIDTFVDQLQRLFAADPVLAPLFGGGLATRRDAHMAFFTDWFTGHGQYSDSATTTLHAVHADVPITPQVAQRWLAQFGSALRHQGFTDDLDEVLAAAELLVHQLVNLPADAPTTSRRRSDQVASCGPGARTVKAAMLACRRGNIAELHQLTASHPELLDEPRFGSSLLQAATLANQAMSMQWLLDHGVDVNRPSPLPTAVATSALEGVCWVTPLAAARWRQRDRAVDLLAGAVDDIFTAALVGDLTTVLELLDSDPDLAQTADPATDAVTITPVHHALLGGHHQIIARLLKGATSVRAGSRALRIAAEQRDLPAVDLLIAHGADASRVGPGRWVLHPRIAQRLTAAGASAGINTAGQPSGEWIKISCTGNQRRRDDPDFVAALLAHGAQIDGTYRGMSALQVAERAGFEQTIALLHRRSGHSLT